MLWDLYSEARQAQEDKSGSGAGGGVGAPTGQPAGTPQATEGAGRVGMFALGVLSRLLTVLRLMYAVSRYLLVLACLCGTSSQVQPLQSCLLAPMLCQSTVVPVEFA